MRARLDYRSALAHGDFGGGARSWTRRSRARRSCPARWWWRRARRTSPVAQEAARTLAFHGYAAPVIADVGVAGLWRIMAQRPALQAARVLIVAAGMEGALFSVVAGLVAAPVIALPTAVGYGVSEGGRAALRSALASCAPGVLTVNIGNGFGAAAAAIKMLRQMREPGA